MHSGDLSFINISVSTVKSVTLLRRFLKDVKISTTFSTLGIQEKSWFVFFFSLKKITFEEPKFLTYYILIF